MSDYQICSRCVLDTSEPTITFDENGVCQYCHQYDNRIQKKKISAEEKEKILNSTIANIKKSGKGKEYDCLIGISGGVDSSYVAYLTKKLGLKPLAIHFDNGWNTELAVSNIEGICKKLDVDLYTYVVNWHEFKDLQKAFLNASVRNVEIPTDHGIFACLFRMAKKYKIKYIINGFNTNTEFTRFDFEGIGRSWGDYKYLKAIHSRFGNEKLKTYPSLSLKQKFINRHILKIHEFSILNFIDFNKSEAMRVLKEELDWRPYSGKHHESIFTKWHQTVYLLQKFKFDKRRVHLSDLIYSGEITRQEAIDELSESPLSDIEKKELEAFLKKKLNFSDSEYEAILNAPTRSYKDFPNSKNLQDWYSKKIKNA